MKNSNLLSVILPVLLAQSLLLLAMPAATAQLVVPPEIPLPKTIATVPDPVLPQVITPKVLTNLIKDATPPKGITNGKLAGEVYRIISEQLASYHWKLVQATDSSNKEILSLMDKTLKPTLEFNKNPKNNQKFVNFSLGCNRLHASYTLTDNVLIISQSASTMMVCPAPIDKAETQLADLMQGTSQLSLKIGDMPFLTQITEKNATLVWQGTQTARSRYAQEPEMVFLAIAPDTQFCDNKTTRQCLQIKPVTYVDNKKVVAGAWLLFDGAIEGYNHIDGEAQVIWVERYTVVATPSKPKHYVYVLDQVIETARVNKK